jgi:delta(3,5)-delta(2,4)-dienoyl-CoA isomerase
LQRLPKIIGNQSWVREIVYTARNISAKEALEFGLISRIFNDKNDLKSSSLELGKKIALKSPIATLGSKHILIHARDHSVADGLEYTALWSSCMLNTPDVPNSAIASLQKKTVLFPKL